MDKRTYDPTTAADAPPSYDSLEDVHLELKKKFKSDGSSSSLTQPFTASSGSFGSPVPKKNKGKFKPSHFWFNSSASNARSSREVHTTVLRLIRELVKEHTSSTLASAGILKSCVDACAKHDMQLSELLQQKYIEDHTPLYWVIVKRLPDGHPQPEEEDGQGPDLLSAFIEYASPLKEETINDIRLACLATSDQKLFQRLKQLPEIGRLSSVDQMLLGANAPPDEIEIEEMSANGEMFAAEFVIPQFHKRMVVSKAIVLEFIARRLFLFFSLKDFSWLTSLQGRLWTFTFFVAPETWVDTEPPGGSWCVSLELQETSPPTHVDSRLHIRGPNVVKSPEPTPRFPISPSYFTSPLNSMSPKRINSRSSNTLRLKTSTGPLVAPSKHSRGNRIVQSLEKCLNVATLQYGDNLYIGSDQMLRARFEAKLGRPETDCIIC